MRAQPIKPANRLTCRFRAARRQAEPEATGAAVAYLATSDDAQSLLGKWIYAPKLTKDLGLLG